MADGTLSVDIAGRGGSSAAGRRSHSSDPSSTASAERRMVDLGLTLAYAEALLAAVPDRLAPDIDRLARALEQRTETSRRLPGERSHAARRPVT